MSTVNDFKVFAGAPGADVISQPSYEALAALTNGFATGTAISGQLNKVWRQSSIMAAVLGQFIVDHSGNDALDDGTVATLLTNLENAVNAMVSSGLSGVAFLNAVQLWTKAQRSSVVALVDAGTINLDLSASNDFSVTLGGSRTLTYSNAVAGQSGTLFVTQDATGSRVLSYTGFKFYGGVAPVLTTAANAIDHLHYKVGPGGLVTLALGRDSK